MSLRNASWQNPDLYKIALGLGTTNTQNPPPVPLLEQVLGALEIFRIPPGNRKLKTFNINADFQTNLEEWYASGGASIIISTEFIEDQDGTKIYLVTYA